MMDKIQVAPWDGIVLPTCLATRTGLRKCVWSSDRTFYLSTEIKTYPSRIARHAEQGARLTIP